VRLLLALALAGAVAGAAAPPTPDEVRRGAGRLVAASDIPDGTQLHCHDRSFRPPKDVSRHGLGGPWADGAIVSTVGDLATFLRALLRGKLVPSRLLAQMKTVVPGSHGEGLGIFRMPSQCGRSYYGNSGGTPGYATWMAASADARELVVVAVNGVSPDAMQKLGAYLDDELLCR
jgi:CubicO group peptidase (beta-lactamase class C family)